MNFREALDRLAYRQIQTTKTIRKDKEALKLIREVLKASQESPFGIDPLDNVDSSMIDIQGLESGSHIETE